MQQSKKQASKLFHLIIYSSLTHQEEKTFLKMQGGVLMFLGLEWYWRLVIVAALIIIIPMKVRFMKWWSRREQDRKKEQHGKWG